MPTCGGARVRLGRFRFDVTEAQVLEEVAPEVVARERGSEVTRGRPRATHDLRVPAVEAWRGEVVVQVVDLETRQRRKVVLWATTLITWLYQ